MARGGTARTPLRAFAVGLVAVAASGCAFLQRASEGAPPQRTEADAKSESPSLSAHGRFVAFNSPASNLVPGDSNEVDDVFVHDNLTGAVERVSVTSTGTQVSLPSRRPSISDDGRYVAFESSAADLAPGDDDATWDIFVRDRVAGTTTLVSVNDDETQIHAPAAKAVISGDGSRVAFTTTVARSIPDVPLLPAAPFGPYVRDLDTGTTKLFDTLTSYVVPMDYDLALDGGRLVWSYVVVAGLTAHTRAIDVDAGSPLYPIADGPAPPVPVSLMEVAISADGTRVAVAVNATDNQGTVDHAVVTVRSVADPTHPLATIDTPPVANAFLSSDGTRVGIETAIYGVPVLLARAVGEPTWTIVSHSADDRRLIPANQGSMAADGGWFAFTSTAPDIVLGDTNEVADVFTRSVEESWPLPQPS